MDWDFRGANIDRSAIGPGARVDNRWSTGAARDLREELNRIRAVVLASDVDGPARREILGPLDELAGVVAEDGPEPGRIRRLWGTLRTALTTYLPTVANLSAVASLVNDVAGG